MKNEIEFPIQCIPHNQDTAVVYFNNDNKLSSLTYQQLWQKINMLSALLIKSFKQRDIIALSLPEGIDYVIFMLSIWNADMVYLPLRYFAMAEDSEGEKTTDVVNRFKRSKAAALIDSAHPLYQSYKIPTEINEVAHTFPHIQLTAPKPFDLAYIMFSSGTSNYPKMIEIPYEAIMDRIRDHQMRLDISKTNNDCMLGLLNFAWDASIMETLSALTAGIPLVIVPEHIRNEITNLPEIFKIARDKNYTITTMLGIPSIIERLPPQNFVGLKSLLATGESFKKKEKLEEWLRAGIKIFNGWGPTEITFGASIIQINNSTNIPIYKANGNGLFRGISSLLLKKKIPNPNSNNNKKKWCLAEEQDEAEVFIIGKGLGCYRDNSEKNKKNFIKKNRYLEYFDESVIKKFNLDQQECVYRVHDVVKQSKEFILFLRRSDRLIKVVGKQVDLENIEQELRHKGFDYAFVFYNQAIIKAFIYREAGLKDITWMTGVHVYYQITNVHLLQKAQKQSFKIAELLENAIKIPVTQNSITYTDTVANIAKIWRDTWEAVSREDLDPTFFFAVNQHFDKVYGADSFTMMLMMNTVWKQLIKREKEQNTIPPSYSNYMKKRATLQAIAQLVEYSNRQLCNISNDIIEVICKESSANDEALIISLMREIHQSTLSAPYILYCQDEHGKKNPLLPLYVKLQEKLNTSGTEIFQIAYLVTNKEELNLIQQKRQHQAIINKIGKAQLKILNSPINAKLSVPLDQRHVCILGNMMSGKTTALIATAKALWHKFLEEFKRKLNSHDFLTMKENYLPIYFSLCGVDQHAIKTWLERVAHLSMDEIQVLNNYYKIIYFLDDYDLLAREDFPSLINESRSQLVIACRQRHMLDERSWNNLSDYYRHYLPDPNSLPLIKNVMKHEERRLGASSLNTAFAANSEIAMTLIKYTGCIFSLKLQPSSWEGLQKNFYLHNLPHFNFIRELLIPVDSNNNNKEDFYKIPHFSFLKKKDEDVPKSNSPQTKLPSQWQDMYSELRQFSPHAKPIFAFAPITGEVPGYYSILSDELGAYQPFYTFKLLKEPTPQEANLDTRAEGYASIIQEIYPQGSLIMLGWSFGGIQAYATAKYLIALGRQIDLIINIDCAWEEEKLEDLNIDKQYAHLEPKLIERYKGKTVDEQDQALKNARYNLAVNHNYLMNEQQKNHKEEKLDVSMVVFIAEEKDTGITTNPKFDWPVTTLRKIDIAKSTHFTIFESGEFKEKIKKEIYALQTYKPLGSIEERLCAYSRKRFESIELPTRYQTLDITQYGIKQNETLQTIVLTMALNTTIVLLGEPGSGKSTTLLALEKQLLGEFLQTAGKDKEKPLAVYIALSHSHIKTLGAVLMDLGLSWQEITSHAYKDIIFLLDTFDEAKDKENTEKFIKALSRYGKIVISCRDYYYQMLENKYALFGAHQLYNLAPLTFDQVKAIINNPAVAKFIGKIFELKVFVQNPLSLSLLMEILPELTSRELITAITRYEIYAMFFKRLFVEKELQLRQEKGVRPGVNLIKVFENYCQQMSYRVLNEDMAEAVKEPGTDADTLVAQRAFWVKQHQTFAEFFLARRLFDDINQSYLNLNYFNRRSYIENHSLLAFLREQIMLLTDETYIQFLNKLFILVYASRKTKSKEAIVAASNAMTLLKKFMSFSNLDLSHIKLEGTDLSHSLFYNTNLNNSSLKKVNLELSMIEKTYLMDTCLEDINIGHLPPYRISEEINASTIVNAEIFAYATGRKVFLVNIYGDRKALKVWDLDLRSEEEFYIQRLAFEPTGNIFAAVIAKESVTTDEGVHAEAQYLIIHNGSYVAKRIPFSAGKNVGIKFSEAKQGFICWQPKAIYLYDLDGNEVKKIVIDGLFPPDSYISIDAVDDALEKISSQGFIESLIIKMQPQPQILRRLPGEDVGVYFLSPKLFCSASRHKIAFEYFGDPKEIFAIDCTRKTVNSSSLSFSSDCSILAYQVGFQRGINFYRLPKFSNLYQKDYYYSEFPEDYTEVTSIKEFVITRKESDFTVINLARGRKTYKIPSASFSSNGMLLDCYKTDENNNNNELQKNTLTPDKAHLVSIITGKVIDTINLPKFYSPRMFFHDTTKKLLMYNNVAIWVYPDNIGYNISACNLTILKILVQQTKIYILAIEAYTPIIKFIEWNTKQSFTTILCSIYTGNNSLAAFFMKNETFCLIFKNGFIIKFKISDLPNKWKLIRVESPDEIGNFTPIFKGNYIAGVALKGTWKAYVIIDVDNGSIIYQYKIPGSYNLLNSSGGLKWNEELQCLFDDCFFWRLEHHDNKFTHSLIYYLETELHIGEVYISNKTKMDTQTQLTFKDINKDCILQTDQLPQQLLTLPQSKLSGQTIFQTQSIDKYSSLPIDVLDKIFSYLSYYDKLILSLCTKSLRLLLNSHSQDKLLTQSDIKTLMLSIKHYVKYLLINTCRHAPDENTFSVKPDKVNSVDLLKVGFFSNQKKYEINIPVKQLSFRDVFPPAQKQ